jgi:hypothetical protein
MGRHTTKGKDCLPSPMVWMCGELRFNSTTKEGGIGGTWDTHRGRGYINFTILLLTNGVRGGRGRAKPEGETPRQGVRIFPKLFQQVLIFQGMREQSIN